MKVNESIGTVINFTVPILLHFNIIDVNFNKLIGSFFILIK